MSKVQFEALKDAQVGGQSGQDQIFKVLERMILASEAKQKASLHTIEKDLTDMGLKLRQKETENDMLKAKLAGMEARLTQIEFRETLRPLSVPAPSLAPEIPPVSPIQVPAVTVPPPVALEGPGDGEGLGSKKPPEPADITGLRLFTVAPIGSTTATTTREEVPDLSPFFGFSGYDSETLNIFASSAFTGEERNVQVIGADGKGHKGNFVLSQLAKEAAIPKFSGEVCEFERFRWEFNRHLQKLEQVQGE